MFLAKLYRLTTLLALLAVVLAGCAAPTATISPAAAAPTAAQPKPAAAGSAASYELAAGTSASFSVTEQLAGKDLPNDAVGTTTDISGAVSINPDGTIQADASKFVVKAATLRTDNSMRDGYVSSRLLETSKYPEIVFVAKEAKGLPAVLPTSGEISFQLIGDLTIKNVTKSVTWEVTGSIADGTATGTAKTSFTFGEFSLTQPQVRSVLSIVDQINLTVNVVLKQSGS